MATDYKKLITELEDKYENEYGKFNYDAEKDELYKLQRKQLERAGKSGVSDTLARYAANTGMGGSSEAMGAAQQTASQYNSMISDALAAAEQKQYERWSAEKSSLADKIANTKNEALTDAQNRLALGDTSGYKALGYDTSEYERQLESNSTSTEKLGEALGANGMTKAQYESELSHLNEMLRTYSVTDLGSLTYQKYVTRINDAIAKLNREYYGGMSMQGYTVEQLIDRMAEVTGMGEEYPLNYTQYKALADYFSEEGGEAYLRANGITYTPTGSYIPTFHDLER